MLEQIDIYMQKNEIKPSPQTIYKNYSKLLNDLNIGAKIITLLEENRDQSSLLWIWHWILIYDTKTMSNKMKKWI